jgi:plasmid stabilization system protein ParE
MACPIIWSPDARDDLRDIVRFIARDNPRRAESFAYQLMTRTDILHEYPEAGRPVPEYRNPQIREIIFIPYRFYSGGYPPFAAQIRAIESNHTVDSLNV